MNLSRYKHHGKAILLDNGNVLIGGGTNRTETSNSETKEFTIVAGSMKTKRLFSCATLLPGSQVLITGGYDENQNPSANSWIYSYKLSRTN